MFLWSIKVSLKSNNVFRPLLSLRDIFNSYLSLRRESCLHAGRIVCRKSMLCLTIVCDLCWCDRRHTWMPALKIHLFHPQWIVHLKWYIWRLLSSYLWKSSFKNIRNDILIQWRNSRINKKNIITIASVKWKEENVNLLIWIKYFSKFRFQFVVIFTLNQFLLVINARNVVLVKRRWLRHCIPNMICSYI